MNCNFLSVKVSQTHAIYYCTECDRPQTWRVGLKPIRQCKKAQKPCAHLGNETRKVQCQSCGGNVQIRVFQCSVHGECSQSKDVGVKTCQGCQDYSVQSS